MDKKKLNALMVLNGETAYDLAAFIGITRQTFSAKINEKGTEFTQSEIRKIKERYNLSANDLNEIFFGQLVSSKDTN